MIRIGQRVASSFSTKDTATLRGYKLRVPKLLHFIQSCNPSLNNLQANLHQIKF